MAIKISFASILLLFSAFWALGVGRFEISYAQIWQILTNLDFHSSLGYIIWQTRAARIVLAIFVGIGFAAAGSSFQSIFKNPLAAPDILGVASGGGFGAVLALMFGLNIYFIMGFGFVFGALSLFLVILIAGSESRVMIILAGIVISAFFTALISLLKYIADPQDTLPAITYWLLGSLSVSNLGGLGVCICGITLGSAVIFYHRWRHNILMLDDAEAKSLGVNIKVLRLILLAACTLIVACAVSFCGIIGWVGLVVPHIARLIVGANSARVIPFSMFVGAIFMIFIDTIARSISGAELPISVLSAIVGAPFFIFILRRAKGFNL